MAMKVSTEEAGTLLNKYISELTPLLATLETEDARVRLGHLERWLGRRRTAFVRG